MPLNKLANDETGRTQPSLNIGIPQYSAVNDPACKNYFRSKSARQLKPPKETIASEKEISDSLSRFEKLVRNSNAKKYLDDRQKMGAGNWHSHRAITPTTLCMYGNYVMARWHFK